MSSRACGRSLLLEVAVLVVLVLLVLVRGLSREREVVGGDEGGDMREERREREVGETIIELTTIAI